MATLHEALQCLKPTTWAEVPQSPDELREYVRSIFKNGRLNGVVPSSARVGETDPELASFQDQWGKPIKVGGPRENPLGVHVWKLSAHDGGGSWFGRRSVHEGMPFTQWKEKISTEYDETLKVNEKKLQKGQVADKAIRGIGAEKKIETIEVKNEDGSVMAHVTVYHVSAQFPKPTAPRDFVAMIISSEDGLHIGGTKLPGRSWMMVSKPCDHPDVKPKEGYTRGEYESVEIIREIPKASSSGSSSRTSLGDKGSSSGDTPDSSTPKASDAPGDDDVNPVEWIMVSRSDPGGNIPRWMVDKGTPKSVGQDAAKFVNWATQDKKYREKKTTGDDSVKVNPGTASKPEDSDESDHAEDKSDDSDSEPTDSDDQSHHGLIASVTGLINAGIGRLAPYGLNDYVPYPSHHDSQEESSEDEDTEPEEQKTPQSNPSRPKHTRNITDVSFNSTHSESATPIVDEVVKNVAKEEKENGKSKPSMHERDLQKLARRKQGVEARLEAIHAEFEKLQGLNWMGSNTPVRPLKDADSDKSGPRKRGDTRSSTPASIAGTQSSQRESSTSDVPTSQPQPDSPARNQKAISSLVSEQAKLVKRLHKIEGEQMKLATKIEARHRKHAERSEKSKSKSEVESLRAEIKDLKKEVTKLRSERQNWVEIVAALQKENTALHATNAKLSGQEESTRDNDSIKMLFFSL
ncbi:hypothetical protein N7468_001142 [Penicillium chermesinum]|uniref:DUF3074 domain-containing protein n=1 Tax=Penicillium chermesinum TaxID=63820 RepID=A0A9W9TYC2_9EURO|nr:uncharacterized protein N7468_001142 [Penicillium chermesinum]KAJ5246159.1 hypothetical protein N7468_001142 [Penicillium chermesinum]